MDLASHAVTPMDDEVRARFHALTDELQEAVNRISLQEQAHTFLVTAVEAKATQADITLILHKLDHLREDFRLVRRVVFGMIGIILTAIVGIWISSVLQLGSGVLDPR